MFSHQKMVFRFGILSSCVCFSFVLFFPHHHFIFLIFAFVVIVCEVYSLAKKKKKTATTTIIKLTNVATIHSFSSITIVISSSIIINLIGNDWWRFCSRDERSFAIPVRPSSPSAHCSISVRRGVRRRRRVHVSTTPAAAADRTRISRPTSIFTTTL